MSKEHKLKVYVASSWRNIYQQQVVLELRSDGHDVYDFKNPADDSVFAWSEVGIDPLKTTAIELNAALNHPLAAEGFQSDFSALEWADTLVLLLPCGRSAHTEAGWFAGQGKRVIVYMPEPEPPELMYKMFSVITGSINEVCSVCSAFYVDDTTVEP